MSALEKTLAENLRLFTPENIIRELLYTNRVYDYYNKKLISYVQSIEDVLVELNETYKDVYFKCVSKPPPGGQDFFSAYGYVLIKVAKKLQIMKTQWSIYQARFQIFLNSLRSTTSQFIMFASFASH